MTHALWKRLLAVVSITVWMVWGYIRLMPPSDLFRHGHLNASLYSLWAYKNLAYSDIVKLYQTRDLFAHLIPYAQNAIQYPVITGLFMSGAASGKSLASYFFITLVAFWIIALVVYFLLEQVAPKGALYFALLPLLFVYGLLNWDLLGIGLMVAAWLLYQREWHGTSAVFFSLAVFAKLFPVFFLPFIAADLWRTGQKRSLSRMVITFVVTSIIINVPFAVANFKNWAYFFTFNAGRPLQADIYNNKWIHGVSVPTADGLSLAMVLAATIFFMWRVYRGGRIIDAAAITFAVFLFFNKIYSPQYTLWMFVLAIMAEWPIWTYLALTFSGLADYVNSFSVLYLVASKSASTSWYVGHVFELGVLYRYLTLAVVAVAGAFSRPADAAGQAARRLSLNRLL